MSNDFEEEIEKIEELIANRKRNLREVKKFYEEEKITLEKDSRSYVELKLFSNIVFYSHYLSIKLLYQKLHYQLKVNCEDKIEKYTNLFIEECNKHNELINSHNYDLSKNNLYEFDLINFCLVKVEIKRKIGF